jgi:ribonuclease P protein component
MEEKLLHGEEPGAERDSRFRTRRDLNSLSGAKTFAQFDLSKLKGRQTFCAEEKLKSKKLIDQLFNEGKSVSQNGFTLVYLICPLHSFYPARAGFSVPKKFFKHAVDRNRVKRLMREVYRANKINLYQKLAPQKQQLALMWIYKGKKLPDIKTVETALVSILNKLKV